MKCATPRPGPGADVASSGPDRRKRAQRWRSGLGADVAGVSPVPAQMWQAGVSPVPAQMWQAGVSPVPAQMLVGVSPVPAQVWQE